MSNDERLIWFKGNIVSIDRAKINVLSPTSQFGANVFEGLRAYWSISEKQLYVFRLPEHIDRLQRSMKMLEFDVVFTNAFLQQSVIDVIQANNFQEDLVCRQTVFLDGLVDSSRLEYLNIKTID